MASQFDNRNLKRTLAGLSFAALASLWADHSAAQLINSSQVSGVPIRQIQPSISSASPAPSMQASSMQAMSSATYSQHSYSANAYSHATTYSQPAGSYGALTVRTVAAADTSSQSQRTAVNSIPWDKLNAEGTRKLKEIVDRPSIYRRLPVNQISCDPQFYTFSIRNPETIVNMWQVFGVTTMGLNRTGPYTFAGDDGAGTDCTAELIYGDANTHIYVGTGTYEGPVFRRKITGRCVAILRTDVTPGASQYDLTNQLDVFIKVDNLAADLVAKTLNPLVGRTADHNFRESLTFLQAFSDSAAKDPNRVAYLANKLNIDPNTKTQFQQVVSGIQARQQQYDPQPSQTTQAQYSTETAARR